MKHQPHSLRSSLIRIGVAVVLVAGSLGYVSWRQSRAPALYDITVVPATCTESGYTLYTSKQDGSTRVDDVILAAGHSFGPWTVTGTGSEVDCGRSSRSCTVCGQEETEVSYPRQSIPVVALTGDLSGIGKKSEVPITARFLSHDGDFTRFATLKYQGHESLNYDKKNYTLKLYTDESRTEKDKMVFSHWNKENKYILKANYIDPTLCRNLVCADVWADMVACRENVPGELKKLSNYGAVDGFPVALYVNEQFQGLYTWNLHKDDDLFGMEADAHHAILITNSDSSDEAFFRGPAQFSGDSPWEVEFCGTEDTQWAQDKLNSLIRLVMESDDETFRQELGRHLDIESAADYLLSVYALGLTHHGARDLILVCYGQDDPFLASLYDMENAFGLYDGGTGFYSPEEHLPSNQEGKWDSATGSLLWDRFLENFYPEIAERYTQLRQNVLEPQTLQKRVTDYMDAIGPGLYDANTSAFSLPGGDADQRQQITTYIARRLELLDQTFLKVED